MSTIVGLDNNKKLSSTEIYDTDAKALQSDINKNQIAINNSQSELNKDRPQVRYFSVTGQTSTVGTFIANIPDDIKACRSVHFLRAEVSSNLNYFARYYYRTGEYFCLGISRYDFVNLDNGTATVGIYVLVQE